MSNKGVVVSEQAKPLPPSELDIAQLRDTMIKGMYTLESALFGQATYEFTRNNKIKQLLTQIEDELFTKENLDQLDPVQKMKLYEVLNRNMNTSLMFLQNLHINLTTGIEAVKHLEKEKSSQIPKDSTTVGTQLDGIKNLILAKIKEKLK